jgi:hypothetical protein
MPSYSPQLYPDVGEQQNPGAAVSYNNTLYYIGNGHASGIWVLSRSLNPGSLDPNEDPDQEETYWTQYVLDEESSFQQPIQYSAATSQQPGAAVAGDNLYFAWIQDDATDNQPSGSVWATQLAPDASGQGTTWSQPVRLCDTVGNPLDIGGANFTLTGWGDYLVGAFNNADTNIGPQFLVYDTGDWPSLPQGSPSSWSAIAGWSNSFADWPNFPPPGQLGNQISMDWFTTAGTPPSSTGPALYCIVSFFNNTTGTAYVLHMMNILPFDQWSSDVQPFQTWKVEQWTNLAAGVSIIRDPAGRVRAYYPDGSNGNIITVRVLATDTISSDGYMWNLFGPPAPLYDQANAAQMTPVPAFVLGAPQTTTANGKQTVLQVYEFVIFPPYGHQHIFLVFSNFGKAVEIPDACQSSFSNLVQPTEQKLVITGVIDSPLPMPAVNVAGRPTPYTNQTVGSIIYGTTSVLNDQYSTNWSWSAGIITTGKCTTGVGPAWNISFKAGTSGATGGSSSTQLGIQEIASTAVGDMVTKTLSPEGALFTADVVYHRNEYCFYDLSLDGTTYTPATNAPVMTSVWIEYEGADSKSPNAYANTVGNIWSYTRDGWNTGMQKLGYPGDNYFDDVIALQDADGNYVNAVTFQVDGSANPYLHFAWSPTSQIQSTVNVVTTNFVQSGWHLDASAYVGASWAGGIDFFGVGEKETAELLIGGSYSRTAQQTTTSGNSWGITPNYTLQNPPLYPAYPGSTYPGFVTAFSFNLWLLQANSQWTDEVINYATGLPDGTVIDPGSEPWRIIFEVLPDDIVFQGDNKNLVYCDKDGQLIEAWYNPASTYSYGPPEPAIEAAGYWGWTNLSQVASAGSSGSLPNAVGAPYWFAWGLSQPGYRPYTQAVVFRSGNGGIYLLSGVQWPASSTSPAPPDLTAWQWCDLGQTPGFVAAAGDPAGFYWEEGPSGQPKLHVFYRGLDGDIHELWATELNQQQWASSNLTGSFPQAQKPASDPCALVWGEDPAGASAHVFYRGNDNQIYELYNASNTFAWGQTNLSQASGDGATPEGKPGAFVWNASLHVGYRGSTGEIHELRRQDNAWQPADDPSWDAHATAPARRGAAIPICGLAWERRLAPQTIHWFYLTVGGAVAELFRYDGAPNSWGWNNLSAQATGVGNSGQLPPVLEILQGNVWYFDPVNGSSMQLYLRDQNGSIFELRFVPDAPASQDGSWEWTELTEWVTDAQGNPLPTASISG